MAELEAEERDASQKKGSKARRKKNKQKGALGPPPVSEFLSLSLSLSPPPSLSLSLAIPDRGLRGFARTQAV